MKQRYLRNVATVRLDETKCTGCGICTEVCPHEVLALSDRKAAIVDRDACMECGACARNCPFGAVEVAAGVGCAYAIIKGSITGTEPDCCGSGSCC